MLVYGKVGQVEGGSYQDGGSGDMIYQDIQKQLFKKCMH